MAYTAYGIDYTGGLRAATIDRGTVDGHRVSFVCRYLSGFSKDLTPVETADLSAAGISIVVVWETTATRAEAGRAAGVRDATMADAEARRCGMPPGRPIYMAVDEDTTVGPNLTAYFEGVASVIGLARTGAYGGYKVIKGLFDAHLITWGWQTYAWSGGRWDSRAQLQQYSNSRTLAGADVDFDRATTTDYGQWRVGVTPSPQPTPSTEEDPMPSGNFRLTAEDNYKFPIPWEPGATLQVAFWVDNSLGVKSTDGAEAKATDPQWLRVCIMDVSGAVQQNLNFQVGRGPTDKGTKPEWINVGHPASAFAATVSISDHGPAATERISFVTSNKIVFKP